MSNILQIGYTAEGTTDQRFLSNIIRKTFEYAVYDCHSEIEVYEPEFLAKQGENFVSQIEKIVKEYSYFHVICIHCDSDSPTIDDVFRNKITPALNAVTLLDDVCKNLVAIVPVQMTEAWLMADFELLKAKIGTTKSNNELGLPNRINQVERIADPKEVVSSAIKIAQAGLTRKRRKLVISSLYSPISQEVSIEYLIQLPSFNRFLNEVRNALKRLNY